jgi:hypothetical protein
MREQVARTPALSIAFRAGVAPHRRVSYGLRGRESRRAPTGDRAPDRVGANAPSEARILVARGSEVREMLGRVR